MKEISRNESKKIMLDLLKEVADFCDQNNITYYLSSGTSFNKSNIIFLDSFLDISFILLFHFNLTKKFPSLLQRNS